MQGAPPRYANYTVSVGDILLIYNSSNYTAGPFAVTSGASIIQTTTSGDGKMQVTLCEATSTTVQVAINSSDVDGTTRRMVLRLI